MTNKQLLKLFRSLQIYCFSHAPCYCNLCRFQMKDRRCQISALAKTLIKDPACWNIEEIERIINETD